MAKNQSVSIAAGAVSAGEETGSGRVSPSPGAPGKSKNPPALEGRFIYEAGHGGLELHATDARAREDLEACFEGVCALSICICLDGAVDAEIGERKLRLDASRGPVGMIWNLTRNERIRRRSAAWRRDRKVVVILQPEWFATADGGGAMPSAQRVRAQHLAMRDWTPSRRSLKCAEQILQSAGQEDGLGRLAREALALEIACEAFGALSDETKRRPASNSAAGQEGLATRDVERARLARAYIDDNLAGDLCLGSIARGCGMSASTLQRVFKSCFGVTVVDHLRRRRLETARQALMSDGVSVAVAASIARYTSAASFATAYQREFGHPPSHTRN